MDFGAVYNSCAINIATLNKEQNLQPPSIGDTNLFDTIPDEMLLRIFLEAANKRKAVFERVKDSGILNLRFVSRRFSQMYQTAIKALINEQAISLQILGCKKAQQAVDYVKTHDLRSANLENFPDIHEGHVRQLIEYCPRLSRLLIKTNHFVLSYETFKPLEFWNFRELKELQIQSASHLQSFDLSQNDMLELVSVKYCHFFVSLTLPKKASNLKHVACDTCEHLESLTLPEQAPLLETIDCIYSKKLLSISLPREIPHLKRLWAPTCTRLSFVSFPKEAPRLELIHLLASPGLSSLKMPESAPSLKSIEITSTGLKSLAFPEIVPSLKKVNCSFNEFLETVSLPEEAPQLESCSFNECVDLTVDNILNFDKYRSKITGTASYISVDNL